MKNIDVLKSQLLFLQCHNGDPKDIEELERKIIASKKGSKSKRKGGNYERDVKKIFSTKYPKLELVRTPMSGGFQKATNNKSLRGDVSNVNEDFDFKLHLECKDQATWKLKDWIKQANEDCPKDKVPCVIFHQAQKNEDGKRVQVAEDYICLTLGDFLSVVDDDVLVGEVVKKKKLIRGKK